MKRALAAICFLSLALTARASVLRITVNDMIHPISDEYIGRALADAAREHDAALVIELTTPGGLLDSTRSIVEKLMTSKVPVIIYVSPTGSRAASAGFFLLEAADAGFDVVAKPRSLFDTCSSAAAQVKAELTAIH